MGKVVSFPDEVGQRATVGDLIFWRVHRPYLDRVESLLRAGIVRHVDPDGRVARWAEIGHEGDGEHLNWGVAEITLLPRSYEHVDFERFLDALRMRKARGFRSIDSVRKFGMRFYR